METFPGETPYNVGEAQISLGFTLESTDYSSPLQYLAENHADMWQNTNPVDGYAGAQDPVNHRAAPAETGMRPIMLEEGWEKETIELGLVALEALVAAVCPRFPLSEMTTDPSINKARQEERTAKACAASDELIMQGIGGAGHQTEFPLAA